MQPTNFKEALKIFSKKSPEKFGLYYKPY